MEIEPRELTDADLELVKYAHGRSVRIRDLMPLAAVWTVGEGTQPYDASLFAD